MGKSEFYAPRLIDGESEQPQIIIDAMALYGLLLRAEMMMTKVDRMRYANRAIEQILDIIREFYLAYDFEDDREIHLKRMCANIGVFLMTMRIIAERNVICVTPKENSDFATPDGIKRQIVEHLAKLDEGATKWRKSFMKSKTRGKGTTGIR